VKLVLILSLLVLIGCAQTPPRRTDKLSILQGVTSGKEVEFSVVAPRQRNLRFELRDSNGLVIEPDEVKTVSRDYSEFVIHKIIFSRDQKNDYNLYVFEGEALVDQRLIGKGNLSSEEFKLAIASCLNDYKVKLYQIWEEIFKQNPQYLLLVGNNVYADRSSLGKSLQTDPNRIWDRYLEVRLALPLFFQPKLIPTHAIWNDHDYGQDGGDENYQYKKEALDIFTSFWAQDLAEEAWDKGPGASGLLTIGDFNLYFLDARSFRSSSSLGKHLGINQEKWLFEKLKEEKGPSFLIKGDQFFGAHHNGDSFEGNHPRDFTNFVSELSKIETPFILLSGERHLSEIMQFPRGLFNRPSFEITSGPLHSDLNQEYNLTNPWLVINESQNQNFVMINNLAKDNHWFLDVESIGLKGKVYFRRELAVYIKDLQNNLQEVRKKRRSGKRRYRRFGRRKRGRR
jgi:alkaline phosphatase D